MRLSDAIALGRTLAKPTSSYFLNDGCACARGMACLAIGKKEDVDVSIESLNNWPWLENEFAHPCHGKCEYTNTSAEGFHIINHLMFHVTGDKFRMPFPQTWTLDQLVDWVRSVEPAEDAIVIIESTEVEYASIT